MHWRTGKREMRVALREAGSRPLLTLMASGVNDSYQAVSCHPGYFKSER